MALLEKRANMVRGRHLALPQDTSVHGPELLGLETCTTV